MNDTQLMTLAREYGTPLYLFEQTALRDRVALLRECLPARAELCLAIKANPFALPIIRPYVHRLEVCLPGELNICEACGTAPEEIVLSGVYKDEAMVRHALSLGDIHRYTVESLAQFELLRRLAQEAGRRLPVLLRLTCGSQFGMDADDIRALVAAARDDAWIDIRGLQQFSGTQKTSLRRVERELACADALMAELEETCGFVCREFEYRSRPSRRLLRRARPGRRAGVPRAAGRQAGRHGLPGARSHWKSAAVLPRAAARTSRRSSTRRRTRR